MQAAGGLMTNSTDPSTVSRGLHIYMGGIGVQQFFILVFLALVVSFQLKSAKMEYTERTADWRTLLYVLYASLGLITVSSFTLLITRSSTS